MKCKFKGNIQWITTKGKARDSEPIFPSFKGLSKERRKANKAGTCSGKS